MHIYTGTLSLRMETHALQANTIMETQVLIGSESDLSKFMAQLQKMMDKGTEKLQMMYVYAEFLAAGNLTFYTCSRVPSQSNTTTSQRGAGCATCKACIALASFHIIMPFSKHFLEL